MQLNKVIRLCNRLDKLLVKYKKLHDSLYDEVLNQLEEEAYVKTYKVGLFSTKVVTVVPRLVDSCYGYYLLDANPFVERKFKKQLNILSLYSSIVKVLLDVREEYKKLKIYKEIVRVDDESLEDSEMLSKAVRVIYREYYTFLDKVKDLNYEKQHG